MDGRGGYAGGDGEEDWGGVGEGRNKENIEGLECRRNVFGKIFLFFSEKWGDFDGGEN